VDKAETQTREKRRGKNGKKPQKTQPAKAIIQNPYAKAKQKSTTPASKTKRYRLIGELKTPVHEGWEPKDFHDKNKVISGMFQQLTGVMRNTVRWRSNNPTIHNGKNARETIRTSQTHRRTHKVIPKELMDSWRLH